MTRPRQMTMADYLPDMAPMPEADPPTLAVHPFAAAFPLMGEEELAELAEDIRRNGLVHDLVLDQTRTLLVDGRNRLAACELAGVEPRFMALPRGIDPVTYIMSVNVERRHLSKGQRAMLFVVGKNSLNEFSTHGGWLEAANALDLKPGRISEAVTIYRYAPKLIDRVIAGDLSLNDAVITARANKKDIDTADDREAKKLEQLARLQAEAPDLAQLVADGDLAVGEAITQLDERIKDERERRERSTSYFVKSTAMLDLVFSRPAADTLDRWVADLPEAKSEPFASRVWNVEGLRRLGAGFLALADEMEERDGAAQQ